MKIIRKESKVVKPSMDRAFINIIGSSLRGNMLLRNEGTSIMKRLEGKR